MPADDDSEDAPPPPKKQETKKVPPKKTTAEKKAVDPSALEAAPAPKKATGGTKKITKGETPAAKPPADEPPAAEEKPKKGTGPVKKPLGKPEGKLGGKPGGKPKRERAPGPPPAPPAVRGPIDYALGALAPVACGGLGAFAFLTIGKAVAHCNNPILADSIPNPVVDIPKAVDVAWAAQFPWAPIAVGAVLGLMATFCFLKMAPGLGARLMGGGMMAFGLLATLPFLLAGQSIDSAVRSKLKKEYAIPRGADVDPAVLNFQATDFDQRRFRAIWAVDLDGGDIPLSWIAMSQDPVPAAKDTPEDEAKIKNLDLRFALAKGRELGADKKDPETWKRLLELKEKAVQEISTPGEEATKLDEGWRKFEARCKNPPPNGLAKPPKPKGADAWFERFTLFGDFGKQGTSTDDRAYYMKYYFGKAVHAAVKEIPADMRFAGCFRGEVKTEAPASGLTRYDFVWVCYDLEKPDREPVLVPHIKALMDEARYKIEILGEKGPGGSGGGSGMKPAGNKPSNEPAKPAEKSDEKPEKPAEKPDEKPAEKPEGEK